MFSGLGSIADLNSTFSSFTNALSLDNMQPGGEKIDGNAAPDSASGGTIDKPPEAPAKPQKTKREMDLELKYQRKIEQLENLIQKRDAEIQYLRDTDPQNNSNEQNYLTKENKQLMSQNEQLLNQWNDSQQMVLEKEHEIVKLQAKLLEQETKYKGLESTHYEEMQNHEIKMREYIQHTEELQKIAKKELKGKDKDLAKAERTWHNTQQELENQIQFLQKQLEESTQVIPVPVDTNNTDQIITALKAQLELQTTLTHTQMESLQTEYLQKEASLNQTIDELTIEVELLRVQVHSHADGDHTPTPSTPSSSSATSQPTLETTTPNKRNFKKLQKQNEELMQELQGKEVLIEELEVKVQALQTQNTSSTTRVEGESEEDANKNDFKTIAVEQETKLNTLQAQYDSLNSEYQALQAELSNQSKEYALLCNQVEELQRIVTSITAENEDLVNEKASIFEEKQALAITLQEKIIEFQHIHDTLRHKVEALQGVITTYEQAQSSLHEMNEKTSSELMVTLQEQTFKLAQLDGENKTFQANIQSLQQETIPALQQTIEIKETTIQEKEKMILELQEQLTQWQKSSNEKDTTLTMELQTLTKQKETEVASLQTKLTIEQQEKLKMQQEHTEKMNTMTDKLKDLMQRYAELRTKAQQAEQKYTTQSAEYEKGLQSKESEIVKMKLKYERQTQSLEEMTYRVQELTEKYGELQRQISEYKGKVTRQQDELQGYYQTEIIAKEQQAQQKEIIDTLTNQVTLLQQELLTLQSQHQSEETNRLSNQTNQIITLEQEKKALTEQLYYLTKENEVFSQQCAQNTEYEIMLENYKKKATVTLKKVNIIVLHCWI